MKQGKQSIVELAQEIARRASAKEDLIADTRRLEMQVVGEGADAKLALHAEGRGFYAPTAHCHWQVADHVGIPAKYYNRMANTAPGLLTTNVNHWFQNAPERRMVRLLDGQARAFLSDRYRRIDNEDVCEAILPALLEAPDDVQIVSTEVTDLRLYIKALFPKIEGEVTKGDVVQAGIVITNSEVGQGAFSVKPLIYRLVCTNGMIREDGSLSRNHVGRRLEAAEDFTVYQSDTLAADDKALALKMRDAVRSSFDAVRFQMHLDKLREATEGEKIAKPAAAIEVLAKTLPITQAEGDSILERLIRYGDYSRYGLANAITNLANDVASYDRATELEMFGGRLIDLAMKDWNRIAVAA
jgi:hypothetical protein